MHKAEKAAVRFVVVKSLAVAQRRSHVLLQGVAKGARGDAVMFAKCVHLLVDVAGLYHFRNYGRRKGIESAPRVERAVIQKAGDEGVVGGYPSQTKARPQKFAERVDGEHCGIFRVVKLVQTGWERGVPRKELVDLVGNCSCEMGRARFEVSQARWVYIARAGILT